MIILIASTPEELRQEFLKRLEWGLKNANRDLQTKKRLHDRKIALGQAMVYQRLIDEIEFAPIIMDANDVLPKKEATVLPPTVEDVLEQAGQNPKALDKDKLLSILKAAKDAGNEGTISVPFKDIMREEKPVTVLTPDKPRRKTKGII